MVTLKKKALISTVVFFIVLLFATATIIREKEKNVPSDDVIVADSPIIFYYGYNCPHCELVEEYLEENDVAAKVRFSKKEVYKNKANAAEAVEKAATCGIGADKLGVPFLFDGKNCYVGDEKIINFFKAKVEKAEKTGSEAVIDAAAAAAQTATEDGAATAGAVAGEEASGAVEGVSTKEPVATDAVLYYSISCPHCKVVEEYIEANRVGEKVKFAQKEVSQIAENREDFIAKASSCGIAPESMGVPMLHAAGKCYLGEDQIINYFKEKSNEG